MLTTKQIEQELKSLQTHIDLLKVQLGLGPEPEVEQIPGPDAAGFDELSADFELPENSDIM